MTRPDRRTPRAHWLLLLVGCLVLLFALGVHGYAGGVGAEGSGPAPVSGPPAADMSDAGPVLAFGPDGRVRQSTLPAGTTALTFDDGPDPRWTPAVLDVLRRHGARATFFVVGAKVNRHPELARRIVAEGHELAVHTFTHVDLATVPVWRQRLELHLTATAIAAATGVPPRLMRPPYSATPRQVTQAQRAVLRNAATAGYFVVLADHDTADWQRPGVAAIVRDAGPATGAGVVLMHDSGGDRGQTVEAVGRILAAAPGTRFVTVGEGLGLPAAAPADPATRARGTLTRWTQTVAGWAARGLGWLVAGAVVLALARLAVQVGAAHRHARRRPRGRLRHLGPVSVIVPAWNEAANIAATVRSLVDSDYPDVEVVVVDDGSTDGTADIVRRLGLDRVRVLSQANAGKPAALNTGISVARGDLLILVDGDTVFEPDAVGLLVQPFTDPAVGAVSGNTKVANRRGLIGWWQHLEYVVGFNLDRRLFDLAGCMPTVPGAIGAFRRATLVGVDGVPGDTLAEDTDLTMAVLRDGWRVVYVDRAIAWTEAPSTLRQLWRQRYRWCYGTLQAMWKHRAAWRQRGAAGRLGRRGLTYLLVFQVVLPLTAPAVDVYALYGIVFLPWWQTAATWCGFVVLQMLTTTYALYLDRERYRPLWTIPAQMFGYRQVMYLVVIQSVVAALLGGRQRWQAVARAGLAAALTRRGGSVTPTGPG